MLEHIRDGVSNAVIAERLGVSVNTVRTHVSNMLAKLDLGDRRELGRWQGAPVARPGRNWLFATLAAIGQQVGALSFVARGAAIALVVVVGGVAGTVAIRGALSVASVPLLAVPATAPPEDRATDTATATATPTEAAPQSTSATTEVAGVPISVRVWPSADAFVVGRLPAGAEAEIIGRSANADWFAIAGTGWIRNRAGLQIDEVAQFEAIGDGDIVGPMHPSDVVTGIAAVDRVSALVATGDVEGLLAIAAVEERRCSTGPLEPGGAPQCGEGVAADTPVPSLAVTGCDGVYVAADQLPLILEDWLSHRAFAGSPRLYAVLRLDPADRQGRYDALFAYLDGERRQLQLDGRGRILLIGSGCERVAYDLSVRLADGLASGLEFGPPVPPGLDPPVRVELRPDIAVSAARIITDNLNVRVSPRLAALVLGQLHDGAEVAVIGHRSNDGGQWLALANLGWAFYDPEWIDVAEPLDRIIGSGPVSLRPYAGDLRSGVPAIDRVIALAVAGDSAALGELVITAARECSAPPVDVGPTCPAGVAEGTPIDVFYSVSCHGSYSTNRDQIDSQLQFFDSVNGQDGTLAPYAAYRLNETSGRTGEYGIAFATASGDEGRVLHLDGAGRITLVNSACGPTPVSTMIPDGVDFLLAPPLPEGLTAVR